MIEIGKELSIKVKVGENDTARKVGSGTLDVLSTPRMIALMEEAAYKCIGDSLEEGATSVGTLMSVKHLSATPVGMEVTATAKVTEAEGRRIAFKVTAYDEAGIIGEGEHERFVVYAEKFVAKTYSKLK